MSSIVIDQTFEKLINLTDGDPIEVKMYESPPLSLLVQPENNATISVQFCFLYRKTNTNWIPWPSGDVTTRTYDTFNSKVGAFLLTASGGSGEVEIIF